jgi:type I restriction enzyme S subunit
MASEWSWKPLSECASWFSGGTPSKSKPDYWGGSIPWISAKSITNFYVHDSEERLTELGARSGTKQVCEGAILLVVRGMSLKTEFRMGIAKRSVTFNQDIKALVASKEFDPLFLAYAIRAKTPTILSLVDEAGHGTGRLRTELLQALKIPMPLHSEQKAIAHILGTLDDKIELNRRMNETLEEMARALFKAWFVDFEPVRAKMEGRWRRGESLVGLPAELYDLFPERLVDSELGVIPEGWRIGTIRDFSTVNPEGWTKKNRPSEIRYVDLSNTKRGRIENVVFYPSEKAPSRAQRVLRPKDTIIGTVRPENGSYAFVSEEGMTGSTGFAVLRPNCDEYAEFVYLAVTSPENIAALSRLADGGAYPAVRSEVVGDTRVLNAGGKVLREFSSNVGALLQRIAFNERSTRVLADALGALLPKLISGELRVENIGQFLGAV